MGYGRGTCPRDIFRKRSTTGTRGTRKARRPYKYVPPVVSPTASTSHVCGPGRSRGMWRSRPVIAQSTSRSKGCQWALHSPRRRANAIRTSVTSLTSILLWVLHSRPVRLTNASPLIRVVPEGPHEKGASRRPFPIAGSLSWIPTRAVRTDRGPRTSPLDSRRCLSPGRQATWSYSRQRTVVPAKSTGGGASQLAPEGGAGALTVLGNKAV